MCLCHIKDKNFFFPVVAKRPPYSCSSCHWSLRFGGSCLLRFLMWFKCRLSAEYQPEFDLPKCSSALKGFRIEAFKAWNTKTKSGLNETQSYHTLTLLENLTPNHQVVIQPVLDNCLHLQAKPRMWSSLPEMLLAKTPPALLSDCLVCLCGTEEMWDVSTSPPWARSITDRTARRDTPACAHACRVCAFNCVCTGVRVKEKAPHVMRVHVLAEAVCVFPIITMWWGE